MAYIKLNLNLTHQIIHCDNYQNAHKNIFKNHKYQKMNMFKS